MTSRERLLAKMHGLPADRTPVAPFVHGNVVREWKADPNADLIAGTIEYCAHFGFDVILRNFSIRHSDALSTPEWRVETRSAASGANTVEITEIETPKGRLRQQVVCTRLSAYTEVRSHREHFIKTPADFELLRRYQPPPAPPAPDALRRAKRAIGDAGILAPWFTGVFNYMADLRSLEDLLVDTYDDPGFYAELAAYALHRLKTAAAPLLREGLDMVSYTGNIANSSMVGPKYFSAHVLPYEKALIDYLQAGRCGVLYHNCGDASMLIPCYNRLAPWCYESMTEPPYADNSLEQCLREFSQSITLMGNIDQITFLRTAAPQEITARAKAVLKAAEAHPNFILGTSDFIEEQTPEENLRALAAAVCQI